MNTKQPHLFGDFQPMDSAPKGGGAEFTDDPDWVAPPHILILFDSDKMCVGHWSWYYAEYAHGYEEGIEAWVDALNGERLSLHYGPAIGWMPLPTRSEKKTATKITNPALKLAVGAEIEFEIYLDRPDLDKVSDMAYIRALDLLGIDENGHSSRVIGWDRSQCVISLEFIKYIRTGNEHCYFFKTKTTCSEDI